MLSLQPLDIVQEIVSELDDLPDLLHLALTNRAFKDIIIPWHIQFRLIRTHPSYPLLWETLATRPSIAARIRQLEFVSPFTKRIVPTVLVDSFSKNTAVEIDTTVNCFQNLATAVRHMKRLQRLRIRLKDEDPAIPELSSVFNAAARDRHSAKELEVTVEEEEESFYFFASPDALHTYCTRAAGFSSYVEQIWKFTGLTRVIIATSHPANCPQYNDRLIDMLLQCKALTDLSVRLDCYTPTLRLFREGSWPALRRFTSYNPSRVEVCQRATTMAAFFERHDTLECLYFGKEIIIPGCFPRGALTNLRCLYVDCSPGASISSLIPMGFGSNLHHLAGHFSNNCGELLGYMKKLRSISILPEVNAFNKKMRHNSSALQSLDPRLPVAFDDIEAFLSQLPNLPMLSNLHGYMSKIDLENENGLKHFKYVANVFPTLLYAHVRSGYINIERDDSGDFIGYSHVLPSRSEIQRRCGEYFLTMND